MSADSALKLEAIAGSTRRAVRRRTHLWVLCLSVALLATSRRAHADIVPPPERPRWNEHPAPLPQPPPDDDLRRAIGFAGAAIVGAFVVAYALRRRATRSAS